MRLKRITTKEGDVYFVNAKTGERIKTSNGGINPKLLPIITTIIAVLYLILIIGFYKDGFTGFNLEVIILNLAFVLFIVGYYFCWKNELVAGMIFIFWWGIMWIVGLFIAEHEREMGVVLGLPVVTIGILFIVQWASKRSGKKSLS